MSGGLLHLLRAASYLLGPSPPLRGAHSADCLSASRLHRHLILRCLHNRPSTISATRLSTRSTTAHPSTRPHPVPPSSSLRSPPPPSPPPPRPPPPSPPKRLPPPPTPPTPQHRSRRHHHAPPSARPRPRPHYTHTTPLHPPCQQRRRRHRRNPAALLTGLPPQSVPLSLLATSPPP